MIKSSPFSTICPLVHQAGCDTMLSVVGPFLDAKQANGRAIIVANAVTGVGEPHGCNDAEASDTNGPIRTLPSEVPNREVV